MPEKKSPPLKASAVKGAASKESNRDAPAMTQDLGWCRERWGGAIFKHGTEEGQLRATAAMVPNGRVQRRTSRNELA